MKYQCLQLTNYDCGFACLKMILANFHHDENYLFLKQNLNKKNYSFLELANIAKDHNLTLKGYECNDIFLLKKLPCITLVNNQKNNHFVIIKKIKNNKIYLIDPLLGDKCILLKDFEKKWSKKVLLVEKVKKTKCQDYIKFSKYYSSKQIILYFVEIVVLFLVAFLTKYNQDSSPFLICLFVILMFTINQFKIKNMKKYDENEIYPILENNITLFNNEYKLKKELFSLQNKVVLSSFFIGFSLLIILMNDLKNVISLIVIFLITYLINYLKKKNSYLDKINLLESNLTIDNIKQADKLSYQEALYHSLLFCLNCRILVLLSFISCLFNKNYGLFMQNMFIYFIFSSEINNIFEFEKEKLILNKKILFHYLNKNLSE